MNANAMRQTGLRYCQSGGQPWLAGIRHDTNGMRLVPVASCPWLLRELPQWSCSLCAAEFSPPLCCFLQIASIKGETQGSFLVAMGIRGYLLNSNMGVKTPLELRWGNRVSSQVAAGESGLLSICSRNSRFFFSGCWKLGVGWRVATVPETSF